jgi:polyhydroxyalkanoate synthesis regulator phasin
MRARRLTVAVAAGAIAVGAAGVVAYPAFADTPSDSPSASATPSTPDPSGTTAPGDSARQNRIKEQLKSLVDDGTITQDQADKVAEKLAASGAGGGPRMGLRGGGFGVALDEVAKALGMSTADVQSGLADGKSVKDLATAQGKDVNDVITALVTAATTKIDQAVKDGKLTQAQADQIKPNLKERITSMVDNALPKRPGSGQWGGKNGDGPRFRFHGAPGQPGDQGGSATPGPGAPSPDSTSPSTPASPTSPGASDSSFLGAA